PHGSEQEMSGHTAFHQWALLRSAQTPRTTPLMTARPARVAMIRICIQHSASGVLAALRLYGFTASQPPPSMLWLCLVNGPEVLTVPEC
ncbi:MAG TPA: hypothetical protein VGW38_26515, partial [Chloroflexota bacterium]|nr:hypothetical protein [Chloroflexota bacterium]